MKERADKRLKVHAEISISTSLQKQQKLSNYMEKADDYQECLVKWMIDSYQPLSAVEKDSFRAMVYCLNRKAPVIGYDKIRTLLSNKYFDTMHAVTKILKGKDIALTTDAWTSIAKEGYVTCTVHFIEPKTWMLHHFSMGIFKKDSNSSAVDVVHYSEGHMQSFDVTYRQLTCVVTDTKSTMIAAGRIFKEKSSEAGGSTAWHGCEDHKLGGCSRIRRHNGRLSCYSNFLQLFFASYREVEGKDKGKVRSCIDSHSRCCYTLVEHIQHVRTIITFT